MDIRVTILRSMCAVLGLASLAVSAWAQGGTDSRALSDQALQALAESRRPQLSVVVREQSGIQFVEVTMLDGRYPADSLRDQCLTLARLAGGDARGLTIFDSQPGQPAASMRKARFGVSGLIDLNRGVVRLEPIVKAFAGEPAPYTVEAMMVAFAGITPGSSTLRTYKNDGVAVYGSVTQSPPGIEYKIRLLSQDPDKLSIPLAFEPPVREKTVIQPQSRTIWPVILLIIIGSAAAGCLVYFALVGSGKRIPPAPVRKGASRHDD